MAGLTILFQDSWDNLNVVLKGQGNTKLSIWVSLYEAIQWPKQSLYVIFN